MNFKHLLQVIKEDFEFMLELKAEILLVLFIIAGIAIMSGAIAAEPVKVLVIDTGFDFEGNNNVPICLSGNHDYTKTGIQDYHGHGTHISDTIDQYVKGFVRNYLQSPYRELPTKKLNSEVNYCQMVCKYYVEVLTPEASNNNFISFKKCLYSALETKPNVINISGGGTYFDNEERTIIKTLLDRKVTIVAAAGNEGLPFAIQPFYPALYDSRIIVVGNIDNNGKRLKSSNWGPQVDAWEVGLNVFAAIPNGHFTMLTGTSQSTAIFTGKLVRKMLGK